MLKKFLHHPRKLWLRRALFQIHLWMGVLLSAYLFVIGLSGSILVFQQEIRAASLPHPPYNRAHIARASTVLAAAHKHFPQDEITYFELPQPESPWWTIYLEDAHHERNLAYANAATGQILPQRHPLWIDWVLALHIYLLMGRTGFIINCLAGSGLFLLALSGAVLWWPGLRFWTRGMRVSLRHRWQRVNFDLHSAVGFWTLAIVSWWGFTAIYFLFPQPIAAIVNRISPLRGMKPPALIARTQIDSSAAPNLSVDALLKRASLYSHGRIEGMGLAGKQDKTVAIYIDRAAPGDFTHRDIVTLDPKSGALLSLWHYGENRSLGDWFLLLIYPLHFGTLWGMGVKILWALLGLSLPILSLTGLLMYWNRWLSKRASRWLGKTA